jgi:uncharacterized protein YtpQ (UPF0354 family)
LCPDPCGYFRSGFPASGTQAIFYSFVVSMNVNYSKFIICLFILTGCHFAGPGKLNIRQFTERYCDSLRAQFPKGEFFVRDDSTVESRKPGSKFVICSDNPFRIYSGSPDSINSIIKTYVAGTLELFEQDSGIDLDRIVPVIKSTEFLQNWRALIAKKGEKADSLMVYEPYNDQLIIFYVIDKKRNMEFLKQKDLIALGIPLDSLRRRAQNNLKRLLNNVRINRGDGTYFITAGGDYEASLILDESLFTKENMQVKGDFVISIPNRDILFVTGSGDKEGLAKIEQFARKSFATNDHPISDDLFVWNGKKFIKY